MHTHMETAILTDLNFFVVDRAPCSLVRVDPSVPGAEPQSWRREESLSRSD